MNPERLGRYAIERLLGQGGMGRVFAARDPESGEEIALKVLSAGLAEDPEKFRRFEQEVLALARLDHPGIVRLLGPLERDGDLTFFAMERLEGETLSARLRRDGPLPAADALAIARPLFAALAAAHGAGVVHRDIKPGNVFLSGDRVVLTDFGLARMEDITRLTRTGQLMGTLDYMSPEQCEGAGVDLRTDLYAAGIVLYEMLAGDPPFRQASPGAVLRGHLSETAPRIDRIRADLPEGLGRIVSRLLEKNPAKRYAAAEQVLADLEGMRDASRTVTFLPGMRPDPDRPAAPPRRRGRSRRRVGLAAGAAAAALLALFAVWRFAFPAPADPGRETVETAIERMHRAIRGADFESFASCFEPTTLAPFFDADAAAEFRERARAVADFAYRAEIPLRGPPEATAAVRVVVSRALATVLGADTPGPLRLVFATGDGGWRVTEVTEPPGPGRRGERDRKGLVVRVDALFRELNTRGGEFLQRLVREGRIPRERYAETKARLDAVLAEGPIGYEVLESESRVGAGRAVMVVRSPDLARALGIAEDRFDVEFTRTLENPVWRARGMKIHEP